LFAIDTDCTTVQALQMPTQLTIIDLFCGVGGFSLGAAQAGFRPLVGIDIDPDLISGYGLNFPSARAVEADISELDAPAWEEILRGNQPLGIIGGPPCQGFSRIGKREKNDARNRLVGSFIKQVCSLRPAFFVMENVEGLLDSDFEEMLELALRRARDHYELIGPIQLNACDAGVPTDRRRVIVVGYDSARVGRLVPTDFAIKSRSKVTVRDAIEDLPAPNEDDDGDFAWSRYSSGVSLGTYARTMRGSLPRGVGWEASLKRRESEVSGLQKTIHTWEVVERFDRVAAGKTDSISRYPRLSWDGRCPTLRAGTGSERGSFQAARPIHPEEPRVITVREAARLQGFPDAFVFHPTKWHSFRMIGNSVSPPVARKVMAVIRGKIKK
jgi:DNA (cytosine-5)-methyltransferase 1